MSFFLGAHVMATMRRAQRYRADTGRDAAADYCFSPHTWLPRRACASPDCPHFLARRAAAVTSAGEPRVSDEVWRHLECHQPVPGLHRYVRARADEPVETIDAVVRAGAHLLPSGDALAGKVAQIGRAVELHGFGDGGGRGAVEGLVFRQHIARCVPATARLAQSQCCVGCTVQQGNWHGAGQIVGPSNRGRLGLAPSARTFPYQLCFWHAAQHP